MSTIWKIKPHKQVYDKNPGDHVQPTGLIKIQCSCSQLITHSQGHLDRKILRPQWDLAVPQRNPFSLHIKQWELLMTPSSQAQDPCASSWRQMDSAKLLTVIFVSEAKLQKWEGDHNGLESERGKGLLKGHKKAEIRFGVGGEGGKKREWGDAKITLEETERIWGRRSQALQSTEN